MHLFSCNKKKNSFSMEKMNVNVTGGRGGVWRKLFSKRLK